MKTISTSSGRFQLFKDFSKQSEISTGMRPICKVCGVLPCARNYVRNDVVHYRTYCENCRRRKKKLPPQRPLWSSRGYKKKTTCDYCGYRALYSTQTTVYYINGDLKDTAPSNLRTICLNCVEIVKRKEVTWRRGDLEINY